MMETSKGCNHHKLRPSDPVPIDSVKFNSSGKLLKFVCMDKSNNSLKPF